MMAGTAALGAAVIAGTQVAAAAQRPAGPPAATDLAAPKGLAKIRKTAIDRLPLVRGNPRLGACVGGVGNFIAIGLNYSDHADAGAQPGIAAH